MYVTEDNQSYVELPLNGEGMNHTSNSVIQSVQTRDRDTRATRQNEPQVGSSYQRIFRSQSSSECEKSDGHVNVEARNSTSDSSELVQAETSDFPQILDPLHNDDDETHSSLSMDKDGYDDTDRSARPCVSRTLGMRRAYYST